MYQIIPNRWKNPPKSDGSKIQNQVFSLCRTSKWLVTLPTHWRITRLGKKKLAEFDSPSITQWGENLYEGALNCTFCRNELDLCLVEHFWSVTQIWLDWFNPAHFSAYFYKLMFFSQEKLKTDCRTLLWNYSNTLS